ncbi:MAG: biosynthetic arginine decarboxylase [bacterium]
MANLKRWTLADSEELYNVAGWGQGYFGINSQGHMTMAPGGNAAPGGDAARAVLPAGGSGEALRAVGRGIDIKALVDDAVSRGLSLPLLIRFSDILADRVRRFHQGFAAARAAHGYQGRFQGVYPMKVNQQRQVVEAVVRFGAEHGMGLEVGSKAELHAALAALEAPGAMIVCNGYKDPGYIRLALLAQKLGKRIFLVVEKLSELETILQISSSENLAPLLGARVRLVTTGSGRWEDSGGDHSKFGLASWELMEAVERLRSAGKLEHLKMLHAHIGSQITNIRKVTEAAREIGRYYVELRRMGCPVDTVDLGGGIGVDYDGTRSIHGFSANYTEWDYAHEVVGVLGEICRNENVSQPHIVCESGRALTAHHSMLAIDVLEAGSLVNPFAPIGGHVSAPSGQSKGGVEQPDEAEVKMAALLAGLNAKTISAHWAEAQHLRDETNHRFDMGLLALSRRARIDQAFWAVARRVERLKHRLKRVPEELDSLEALMADKYFCNFSVFQSLPDAWAIHQEFPVAPLHRLDERPTRNGVLQDITCDSDGRLIGYIGPSGQRDSLPLHSFHPGEPYYLGIFLTGAYQEILGDLHNLYGDTHAIHVRCAGDGGWEYEQIIGAESVARVLETVQFGREGLTGAIERQVAQAVTTGTMTAAEGEAFREIYARGLDMPTYLDGGREEKLARIEDTGNTRAG